MSKIIFPNSNANVEFKVQGIFATPEEWKATDDANAGLFTYSVRFFQFQIEKGKIFPRELTARELREQQEKNKKGGKKQTKKEQGNAEEQRIKKLQQQEEKKKEQQWSKLTQQDRNCRQYEDTFRSPQLRFQNGTKKVKLQGKQFAIFEQRVGDDQGEWIYVYKMPAATEDQLAKMRKAKPKTLANVNDLNPIIMRAWLDLSSLNSKDQKKLTQRCKLVQVDRAADTPEPNLENTYIKVSIALETPLLRGEDGVAGEQLIADPPAGQSVSDRIKVVNQLRDELRLAVSSLSMEYSSMFWKELNIYEDFKNMNYFINKKNEITKRKQQFLYDFNVSGKYKILKDRIKKVIVHLCQSYFTEQMGTTKSFTGITCSIKDQFYSEIYNFLVTKYRQILQQLIFEKKENLKQIEVLSPSAQKKNVEKLLNSYSQQALEDRISRIVEQYQLLGNYQYGETIFKKYMEAEPSNVSLKYSYSMYCLRNRLKKAEEVLPYTEQYLSYNKDDQKVRLEYLLLLIASQNEENCRKAWVLLREILAIDPYDSKNLMLASFLFKDFLQQEQVGNTLGVRAERSVLRQLGKVSEIGKHKEKPSASELPTLKALPTFSESLSAQEKDQIWIELLNLFLSLNLFNVIEKITPKIKDTSNNIFNVLALKNLLSQSRLEQFEAKAREVYEKHKSVEVLDLLVTFFIISKSNEAEKYLKILLTRSKGESQTVTLLKMANYYLQFKQIGNARACVLKYLEKKPSNSGYSWRILGICELNLNNLEISLECLRKANILDIDNPDNWVWLSKVYSLQGKYSMCNQCLNQYQQMIGKQAARSPVYEEISQIVSNARSQHLGEQKLRVQLVNRLG